MILDFRISPTEPKPNPITLFDSLPWAVVFKTKVNLTFSQVTGCWWLCAINCSNCGSNIKSFLFPTNMKGVLGQWYLISGTHLVAIWSNEGGHIMSNMITNTSCKQAREFQKIQPFNCHHKHTSTGKVVIKRNPQNKKKKNCAVN